MNIRTLLSASLILGAGLVTACDLSRNTSSESGPQPTVSTEAPSHLLPSMGGEVTVSTVPTIASTAADTRMMDADGVPVNEEEIEAVIGKLAEAKGLNSFLAISSELADFGKLAYPHIESRVAKAKGLSRIALLRACYLTSRDNAELDTAVSGITEIAAGKEERQIRLAAAELLEHLASPRHAKKLAKALDASFDTPVKIALAIALWNTSKEDKAIKVLKDLLKSDSENTQLQAAIALGKTSHFSIAQDYLRILANEPTTRGMTASELIRRERLGRKLLNKITGDSNDDSAFVDLETLEHLIDMIGERYIHREKANRTRLKEKAAEGLLKGMDPYCAYLDDAQAKRAESVRRFLVPSLGLHIGALPVGRKAGEREKEGYRAPTVVAVAPGSPAATAGIKPGDIIASVAPGATLKRVFEWRAGAQEKLDETVMDFLSLPLNRVVESMRGTKGAKIALKIRRDNWDLLRWIPMEHADPVELKNTTHELEGGFLYAKVSDFNSKSLSFFKELLASKKKLIIDLRSCAGGSLSAAAKAAELFLPANAIVAHSFGRNEALAPNTKVLADADDRDVLTPLSLLVDGGTADAAELFAAALQDNDRADLYGTQTFGRVILQKIIPIKAKKSKHALLLTVGKYVTPASGQVILYRGLKPDLQVIESKGGERTLEEAVKAGRKAYQEVGPEGWVLDELEILERAKVVTNYTTRVLKDADKALAIVSQDQSKSEGLPDWESFVAQATSRDDIHLSANDLLREVRRQLRVALQAEGKVSPVNLQEDMAFVVALSDMAKKAKVDLTKLESYKQMPTRYRSATSSDEREFKKGERK